MKKQNLCILGLVLATQLAACGRNYNGIYTGTATSGFMERLTLTQNGNTVNGTVNFTAAMNSSAQVNGTVTGTVNGDTLTNVTATLNSCSYQGTLIASGNAPSTTLTGNLTPVSMGTCGSSAPVQVLVTKPN